MSHPHFLHVPASIASETYALAEAAQKGDLEKVKSLVEQGFDPKDKDSAALRYAAAGSHLDVVEYLLPMSNPCALDSTVLRSALAAGRYDVAKMLMPYSEFSDAFISLAAQGASHDPRMLELVSLRSGEEFAASRQRLFTLVSESNDMFFQERVRSAITKIEVAGLSKRVPAGARRKNSGM